jgi:ADP-L-glycero-D-manno-heptose 6-epimerase
MILVTGSNGFIGSNFLKTVTEPTYLISDHYFYLPNVPWEDITKVYHFGAISSTTETNVGLIHRANILFTVDLFAYCAEYNIPIVYASSASVYGNSSDYQINPLNFYALSKVTIDYKAAEMIDNRGLNAVGLRFYNVYGDGEDHKGPQASTVYQFTKQSKEDGVIKVYKGSDKIYRDFVWVGDVVECINTPMPSGIYDVGTSAPISFMNIAEAVAEKYNADIKEVPFPDYLQGKYQRYTCAQKHFDKDFISVKTYLTLCES